MIVEQLELVNFRNYHAASITLGEGTTIIVGDNGQGKTSLAEAIAYLSNLKSFRGVPNEALIRIGADAAIIRATVRHADGREVLVEAEIVKVGRNRTLVNKQRLRRTKDLLGVVRATIFSPDDLDLIKDSPALRREFVDDAATALNSSITDTVAEVDRVLRQRNTLLKQAGGRLTNEISASLDVWDARFVEHATVLGEARARTVAAISPLVHRAYCDLARRDTSVEVVYDPEWRKTSLETQLVAARGDDIRRATTTVGPHRDDIDLWVNGAPARTHASQGEQRTLALALRLAVHRAVHQHIGTPPVLILDDVLSELDPHRSTALLEHVPAGQVLITTASPPPSGAQADHIIRIANGGVVVS